MAGRIFVSKAPDARRGSESGRKPETQAEAEGHFRCVQDEVPPRQPLVTKQMMSVRRRRNGTFFRCYVNIQCGFL